MGGDRGWKHGLREAARASDQRGHEFEAWTCHTLDAHGARYVTSWNLSLPFCKMGITVPITSFCEEHGEFLILSGLLVNIIPFPPSLLTSLLGISIRRPQFPDVLPLVFQNSKASIRNISKLASHLVRTTVPMVLERLR